MCDFPHHLGLVTDKIASDCNERLDGIFVARTVWVREINRDTDQIMNEKLYPKPSHDLALESPNRWLHYAQGALERPHAHGMYFPGLLVALIIQLLSNQVLIICLQLELL